MATNELSRLVALAHAKRAKQNALYIAGMTGKPQNVFVGKHGWLITDVPPVLEQVWHVATPAGQYFTVRRKP